MNILIANIAKMVTYTVNITIVIKYQVAHGLSITIFTLTLAYCKGQLDHWNGASINILAILFDKFWL